MTMATSRMLLDPPPSLIDLPPLVNPHAPPNPHVRLPDLAPTHPQTRRVSSDSQAPGRASPSPRISRKTPVPFLLEAFPAPPSHIPGTPSSLTPSSLLNGPSLLSSATSWLSSASAGSAASTSPVSPSNSNVISPCSPKSTVTMLSHSNPPPSSPPTGPLPPIPGPSSVTSDFFTPRRSLQTAARSASPVHSVTESRRSQSRTEQRPRLSIDVNDAVRGRSRQGSLSSLRNPIHPMGEQSEAIVEEPVEEPYLAPSPSVAVQSPPLFDSVAERKSHDQPRGDSPDILRSCLSRVTATSLRPEDKPCAEDSIASVDISDLNAIKSDNEGDGDDQASRPFPHLLRSQPQSPIDMPSSAPYNRGSRKPSKSSVYSKCLSSTSEGMSSRNGAMSPEITQMISITPRPRKRSTPSRPREPSFARNRKDSSKSRGRVDVPSVPTNSHIVEATVKKTARRRGGDDIICVSGEDEANESDSSLDLHTPLPQLMLRHGMLSPNSKLLPQLEGDSARLSIMSSSSYVSNASLKSTASTCSKHPKDARDTVQRRVRHRDGRLLKGGIGLTTGLGWSDSEDEDAPSPLTRRVSTLVLSRRASSSSVGSYQSSHSQSNPHPLSRSISHNILREDDELDNEHDPDDFGHSNRFSLATRSLPSRSKPVSRVGSVRSIASSRARYSTYSASSIGVRARGGSVSESSIYTASIASKPDNVDVHPGLMPGIREHDDGVTPTRAEFVRSSNGSSGADVPHTPSSTASSSISFPATPESGEEIPHLQPPYNQDKVLPPLPPGLRGKYPSSLSLRSQPGALQRPRTGSMVSNADPVGDVKSNTLSATPTPRQSLAERPAKTTTPAASPRPSLNGTPRPSLTIPKSPFPHQSAISGLPRPTTPSSANAAQAYAPRPLRLAEVNQSPGKGLQPGEQSPRPGQILTYNRNVHDQLKLRALSLNTAPNRAQGPAVSPGGTQMVFVPSPVVGSGLNSALSTPATARSQSPLSSSSPSGEGFRPRPRTGTGMVYRTNLSVGSLPSSRIRVPSTVSR